MEITDNSTVDAVAVIQDLTFFRDELQGKLTRIQAEKLVQQGNPHVEGDSHDLEIQTLETEQNLREAISSGLNKECIEKRLLQAQEAFISMYPGIVHDPDGVKDETVHQNIADKLKKVMNTSMDISKKIDVIDSFQTRLTELNQTLQQVEWKNRDLSLLVDRTSTNSGATRQRLEDAVKNNETTQDLYENLDKSVRELALRRSAFQSFIHASKVDWFSDPELLELMTSLGEPVNP
uniref:Centromere protein H-like n=1 Tax=Phallusia mammillata TaxID=59560 RepID=A0A6F9D8U0_9ASCI|nr:centromere protein H-like [Phallusia mammillata]